VLGVPLLAAALTMGGAAEGVSLGNVTVSSDTDWVEATYEIENLTVTNGATLTIAGGSTVNVAGATTITGSGRILLQGKNTSGQVEGQWLGVGVTINSTDVQVDAGSAISADAQGYLGGFGPGSGGSDAALHGGSGGGYGGVGGRAGDDFNAGGAAYGDAFAPVDLGSGGGPTSATAGRGGEQLHSM